MTDPGSFFAPGHDKRAEAKVIMELFGGVPQFLDAFGYGPDGDEAVASTTWLHDVMRLLKMRADYSERVAIEHLDPTNLGGPFVRTKFEAKRFDFELRDGCILFGMSVGRATAQFVVPFVDILGVYKSPSGYVVRVNASLEFGSDRIEYVARGTPERVPAGRAAMRIMELGPLRTAAMDAWKRLSDEHLPPFHKKVDEAPEQRHPWVPEETFERAVGMLTIDDAALNERCKEFLDAFSTLAECWIATYIGDRANNLSLEPTHLYWNFTQRSWNGVKGAKLVDRAHESYVKLLRHIDGLVG